MFESMFNICKLVSKCTKLHSFTTPNFTNISAAPSQNLQKNWERFSADFSWDTCMQEYIWIEYVPYLFIFMIFLIAENKNVSRK